jgi:HAD superfamily hydrolase (TIGR01544 family)
MTEEIVITNQTKLSEIIQKISADGAGKFHVLADFDRTLTRTFAPDGSETPSLISVLRDENYLTPDYPQKAKDLFAKYHAIEIDLLIPKEEKKIAMKEWWIKHFELLIASRLNKKDVEKAALSERLRLRDGAKEFLEFLRDKKIPLIIMSSAGLGIEAISFFLKNQNCLFENIKIISNEFVWDENGFAIDIKQPIIHCLNKDETVLKDFDFYGDIAGRKNVMLLGDSADDIDMVLGFEYDNLIKIGFLNKPTLENELIYLKNYDILIKNDGTMKKANEILKLAFGN